MQMRSDKSIGGSLLQLHR